MPETLVKTKRGAAGVKEKVPFENRNIAGKIAKNLRFEVIETPGARTQKPDEEEEIFQAGGTSPRHRS